MSISRKQDESFGEFDYNVNNYSVGELYDIFGIRNRDSLYVINQRMTEFFETSRRNPLMTTFLRDAQAEIFNDLAYRGKMTEDINDEDDDDNTDGDAIEEKSILSSSKKLENYYPSTLVVNNHKEVVDSPLDSTPGGDGTINPFVRRTYKKEVCVDSVFKKTTENSNSFTVFFPKKLDNVVSMSMISIDLPNTVYNITNVDNRNQMFISTTDISGVQNATDTITVPPGDYSRDTIISSVNNIMSNSTKGMQYLVFDIDNVTRRSIIRAKMPKDGGASFYPLSDPSAATYSPNFKYTLSFPTYTAKADLVSCDTSPTAGTSQEIYQSGLGWTLGFRKASYDVSGGDVYTDFTSVNGTLYNYKAALVSDALYNDKLQDYIFIDVNDFNNNYVADSIVSATQQSYLGNTLFARIPMATKDDMGLRMYMSDFEPRRDYFGPVTIDRLHLRVLNKYGELVDLGGQDYSCMFAFNVRYA
jgi:hypothetical protein